MIFILGSGICGGAATGGMLIGGRAVQGVGSGGIIMIIGMPFSSQLSSDKKYGLLILT